MLTSNQIEIFEKNGYLVIEDFIDQRQRNLLMQRAEELIDEFQPPTKHSVFSTDEQERTSDDYFLNSGHRFYKVYIFCQFDHLCLFQKLNFQDYH